MTTDGHIDAEQARAFCAALPDAQPMSAVQRLQISDHAAACPDCRARLEAASQAHSPRGGRNALINDLEAMKEAARREIQSEREDLAAFANRLDLFPEEHFAPGGTLPVPSAASQFGENIARAHPLGRWWDLSWLQPGPLLTGITVVAVVLAVGLFIRRGVVTQNAQVVRTVPPLRDGPLVIVADGSIRGTINLTDELRTALADIITRRRLSLPGADLGPLRGGSDRPGKAGESQPAPVAPAPLDPPAGSVVEEVRPILRWTAFPGATGYIVETSSLATDETVSSGPLPASVTNWQPERGMLRGNIYRWKVQVLGDAPPKASAASASLKILGDADENELQQLRSVPEVSRLVLATVYARLNLRKEAKTELQTLHKENPNSPLAADLAGSIP